MRKFTQLSYKEKEAALDIVYNKIRDLIAEGYVEINFVNTKTQKLFNKIKSQNNEKLLKSYLDRENCMIEELMKIALITAHFHRYTDDHKIVDLEGNIFVKNACLQ